MRFSDSIIYKPIAANCTASVHQSVTFDKGEVVFGAKNCHLEIAEGCHFRSLYLYFLSDNTRVTIGPGTLCRSSFWANLSGAGRSITVGAHCLFASVKLRTSDSHHIIDLDSGDMLNPAEDIKIGDHVWIAEDVLVLKGSTIGTGSAVGARSMVRGTIPENSLVAGTPAKILRSNIAWRYSAADANPPNTVSPSDNQNASLQTVPPASKSVAAVTSPATPAIASTSQAGRLPAEVETFWKKLRNHLAPRLVERGDDLVNTPVQPSGASLGSPYGTGPASRQKTLFLKDLLQNGQTIALKGGTFRFREYYDLAVQLEEIICNVQYNFESDSPAPFIIDAGGCYGLAAYWLSRRHPNAEILTFEPNPQNAATIRENIEQIGMQNVVLHEAAVGIEDGTMAFYANEDMPMGSSTLPRLKDMGHEITQLKVDQVNLPDLIAGRQVDFLKLDVEGAEYAILDALDGRMDGIRRMFIELHFGSDLPKSNLARVLDLLDRNGFDHMICRAGNSSPPHPLHAAEPVWNGSLNLWARSQ